MKVALITDSFNPKIGGPFTVIKTTQKVLSKKKINIEIISKLKTISNKYFNLTSFIKKFDICHFYGGWTYFHIKCFLIAFKLKKKIIIDPIGYYEPWSLTQKPIKKKIAWFLYQKKILQKANLIVCSSNLEKKNLLILNKNFKIKVIPYGILENFIKKKIIQKKIKKKAIFFSRIHKKKGVENLIKSWNEINDKNWILDICGPVDDNKYFKKIKLLKKNNKINFIKPIYGDAVKIKLFKKYDVFLLPSHSENFGMVILESLARGLPVLTTTNTPWINIKKLNAGWIINSNLKYLTFALKKIFKSSENDLYIKSRNALKLAKKYNWNNISKLYIKTYSQLINHP
jgi:glycosyltransferase involved in cell wall biosynthesis